MRAYCEEKYIEGSVPHKMAAIAPHTLFKPAGNDHVEGVVSSIITIDMDLVTTRSTNTFMDVMRGVTPQGWSTKQLCSFIIGASVNREYVPATTATLYPVNNQVDGLIAEMCVLQLPVGVAKPFRKMWNEIVRIFLDAAVEVINRNQSSITTSVTAASTGTEQDTQQDIDAFLQKLGTTTRQCYNLLLHPDATTTGGSRPPHIPWFAPQIILAQYDVDFVGGGMPPPNVQQGWVNAMAGRPPEEMRAQAAKLTLGKYSTHLPTPPCVSTFGKCLFLLSRIGLIQGLIYTEIPEFVRWVPRKYLVQVPFRIPAEEIERWRNTTAIDHTRMLEMEKDGEFRTCETARHVWCMRAFLLRIIPGTERFAIGEIPYNQKLVGYSPATGSTEMFGASAHVIIDKVNKFVVRRSPLFVDDIERAFKNGSHAVCIMSKNTRDGLELINISKISSTPGMEKLFCKLLDGALVLPSGSRNPDTLMPWYMDGGVGGDLEVVLRYQICGEQLCTATLNPDEAARVFVTICVIFMERFRVIGQFWTDIHRANILMITRDKEQMFAFQSLDHKKVYQMTLGKRHAIAIDYGMNTRYMNMIRETIEWLVRANMANSQLLVAWNHYGRSMTSTPEQFLTFVDRHVIKAAIAMKIVR